MQKITSFQLLILLTILQDKSWRCNNSSRCKTSDVHDESTILLL